jgi:diacylglycerol kinase family enzyme
MIGAGFDAHVVHRLSLPLKRMTGRGAYVAQSLRELGRYRFPPLQILVDGTELRAASVIVSKGRLYGGRHMLAPGARPDTPGFSVAVFHKGGPAAVLSYGAALPLDLLPRMAGLTLLRASRVQICAGTGIPVQADGDAAGMTPVSISDAPAPIRVVTG